MIMEKFSRKEVNNNLVHIRAKLDRKYAGKLDKLFRDGKNIIKILFVLIIIVSIM